MNKKVVLIGLSVSALMVTTLATAIGTKTNIEAFAENNNSGDYTVVIDSNNRVKETGSSENGWYAFRIRNNDDYGLLYFNYPYPVNFDLPVEYSDYIFSWTEPEGGSVSCFQISINSLEESTYHKKLIDGKYYYVRGFPGAYRITTVYSLSDPTKDAGFRANAGGWSEKSRTSKDGVYTEVFGKDSESSSINIDWSVANGGTLFIKSITIEYTCQYNN